MIMLHKPSIELALLRVGSTIPALQLGKLKLGPAQGLWWAFLQEPRQCCRGGRHGGTCRPQAGPVHLFHAPGHDLTVAPCRFKGIKKGGVTENTSYYIFTQCPDGAFEAFPVHNWYNFTPLARHRTLTAEEAEEEWER